MKLATVYASTHRPRREMENLHHYIRKIVMVTNKNKSTVLLRVGSSSWRFHSTWKYLLVFCVQRQSFTSRGQSCPPEPAALRVHQNGSHPLQPTLFWKTLLNKLCLWRNNSFHNTIVTFDHHPICWVWADDGLLDPSRYHFWYHSKPPPKKSLL